MDGYFFSLLFYALCIGDMDVFIRNYLKVFVLLISLPCLSKTHVGYQQQTYLDHQRSAWNKTQARPIQVNLFYQTQETREESLSTPLFTFGQVVSQAKR